MHYSTAERLIRRVTLRQLQIFEAVVRLGGYTRAAGALHLTQPTVSMQVRKLSDALGLRLIEPVGRRIRPTAAGHDVYATAQDILGRVAALGDAASERRGVIEGELRMAVITGAAHFMPHLLGAFIGRYPRVHPRLTVTNRAVVLDRLKSRMDDLVVMGQVPKALPVEAHAFVETQLVVIAPPTHPLVDAPAVALDQLSRERLLVREEGSGTRRAVEQLFAQRGLTFTPYMELGSNEAIKQAVIAGLGVSVVSGHSVRLERLHDHVRLLNVIGFPLQRHWYAVHLARQQPTLVARTFLDFLLSGGDRVLAELLPSGASG